MRAVFFAWLLGHAAIASSSVQQDVAGSVARASSPTNGLAEVPPALAPYVGNMHRQLIAGNATQDCMAFALAYEFALRAQPARAPNRDVWDALRLGPDCGVAPPPELANMPPFWPPSGPAVASGVPTFYVSPDGDDAGPGSEAAPFRTVQRGVNATRAARAPGTGPAAVILRAGVHILGSTIALDSRDDGLAVSNYPGEAAWVSGGAPLEGLAFSPVDVVPGGANVYSAHVPSPPAFLTSLLTADSSGAPNKRLYRAQFPNFNPEWRCVGRRRVHFCLVQAVLMLAVMYPHFLMMFCSATGACGGGPRAFARPECARDAAASPFLAALGARFASAGGDARSAWGPHGDAAQGRAGLGVNDPAIVGWVKPGHFPTPLTYFRNLSGLGLKNDSIVSGGGSKAKELLRLRYLFSPRTQMTNYNLFAVGRGGACGLWTDAWPEDSSLGWDYQCGNVRVAVCAMTYCQRVPHAPGPSTQVTDGGWEDIVDRLMNTLGQLNLPLGLVFNSSAAPNMANWSVRAAAG